MAVLIFTFMCRITLPKVAFTLSLLFWVALCFAQNPFAANTTWQTSGRIVRDFEEMVLSPINPKLSPRAAYFRISFDTGHHFRAYNIPGCGMDCIVSTTGRYSITDTTVQFTINKITKSRACRGDTLMNNDIGSYHLILNEYQTRLERTLDDEPHENYFAKLNIAVDSFKDADGKRLVKKYEYEYNRIYKIVENKNYKKYYQCLYEAQLWRGDAYAYANAKDKKEQPRFIALANDWHNKLQLLLKEFETVEMQTKLYNDRHTRW